MLNLNQNQLESVKRAANYLSSIGVSDSYESAESLVCLFLSLEQMNKSDSRVEDIDDEEINPDPIDHNFFFFDTKMEKRESRSDQEIEQRRALFTHGMEIGKKHNYEIYKKLRALKLLWIDRESQLRVNTKIYKILTNPKNEQKSALTNLSYEVVYHAAPWAPTDAGSEHIEIPKNGVFYVQKSHESNLKFDTNQQIYSISPELFLKTHPLVLIDMGAGGYTLLVEGNSKSIKEYAHTIEAVAPISIVIVLSDNDDLDTELNEAIESGFIKLENFIIPESHNVNIKGSLGESVLRALECNLNNKEELSSAVNTLQDLKAKINKIDSTSLSDPIQDSQPNHSHYPIDINLISCNNPGELGQAVEQLRYCADRNNARKYVILLSGEPGTGKTAFTELLKYPKVSRFRMGESRQDRYFSGIENRILQGYETCTSDTIFQVDEAEAMIFNRDVLANDRHSTQLSLVNTFLTITDPCRPGSNIILTTNHPEHIDKAVLSRLSYHLHFTMPQLPRLKMIFLFYWNQLSGQYIKSDLDPVIEQAFEPLVGQVSLRDFAIAANIYSEKFSKAITHDPFNYLKLVLSRIESGGC
jgi:hypothetical protein